MTLNAAETLSNLIDETVLKRRITLAFGPSENVRATLLLAGGRLQKIDEIEGVTVPEGTVSSQLAQNDPTQMSGVREMLQKCLEAGMPRISAIEKSLAFDDPTARGPTAREIFDAA